MTPDAIIVLSAGVVSYKDAEGQQRMRSTTFDEADAFGTLGGRDRVEAAALLAKKYPQTFLVVTSSVYADELRGLGTKPERIIETPDPTNTESGVRQALELAKQKGWKKIAFLSSEYHIPRIIAFYEKAQSDVLADGISAEDVLAEHDSTFVEYFARVKRTPAYQKRIESEQEGMKAITRDTYRSAPAEDKLERSV